MKKLLKIIGWLIGILALLIVLAIVIVPLAVDPNDYRDLLVAKVREQTGRTLEIEQNVELSVFPWIGVRTGGVQLNNPDSFDTEMFARVDRLAVRVKLWPLLSRRLEVGRVKLTGLHLRLERDSEGVSNWEDLLKPPAEGAAPATNEPSPSPLAAMSLGGLDIQDARFEWDDRQTGQRFSVQDVSLTTSAIQPGEAVEIGAQFTVQHHNPDALAKIRLTTQALGDPETMRLVLEDLRLEMEASGAALGGGSLTAELLAEARLDGAARRVELSNLGLHLEQGNPDLQSELDLSANLLLDDKADSVSLKNLLVKAQLTHPALGKGPLPIQLQLGAALKPREGMGQIEGARLMVDGITLESDLALENLHQRPAIKGQLSLAEFSPRGWFEKRQMPLPPMADPETLGVASFSMQFAGYIPSAQPNSEPLDLALKTIALNIDQSNLAGEARLRGELRQFRITLDTLDLDRYLPPSTTNAESPAPVQDTSEAVAAQEPGNADTAVNAEDAPLIPVELLRPLELDGNIAIQQLKAANLRLGEIGLVLRAKDGVLSLVPSVASFYQGSYDGRVKLDLVEDEPRLQYEQKLAAVQIGSLLRDLTGKDLLEARGDFNSRLQTSGNSLAQFRRSLGGRLDFKVANGAVKGFNLGLIIRQAYALAKGQPLPDANAPAQTDFSELSGSATIKQGILTNKDLQASSPLLRVTGDGQVDLVQETLDYLVTAYIVNTSTGQGGKELEDLIGIPIPLQLSGPLTAPKSKIQWEKVLLAVQQKRIEGKAGSVIQEKLKGLGLPDAGGLLKGLF